MPKQTHASTRIEIAFDRIGALRSAHKESICLHHLIGGITQHLKRSPAISTHELAERFEESVLFAENIETHLQQMAQPPKAAAA